MGAWQSLLTVPRRAREPQWRARRPMHRQGAAFSQHSIRPP